jgi:hypothetical protein
MRGEQQAVGAEQAGEPEEQGFLDGEPRQGDPRCADGADRPDPQREGKPVAGAQPEGDRGRAQEPVGPLSGQHVVGDGVLERERRSHPDQQQAQVAQVSTQHQQEPSEKADGKPGQRPCGRGDGGHEGAGRRAPAHGAQPPGRDEDDLEYDEGELLDRYRPQLAQYCVGVVGPDTRPYQVPVPGSRPRDGDSGQSCHRQHQRAPTPRSGKEQGSRKGDGEQVEQQVVHRCRPPRRRR